MSKLVGSHRSDHSHQSLAPDPAASDPAASDPAASDPAASDPAAQPWHRLGFEECTTIAPAGNHVHWARRASNHCNGDTTIVFFHGVLRDWRSFYPLFDNLHPVANLVSVDLRGHGQSSSTPDRYRVIDYVEDAVHVLSQLTGKLVVYGHSLGAMVALAVAARRPDDLDLALIEDPPFDTMGSRLTGMPLMHYFAEVERCLGQLGSEFPERSDRKLETTRRDSSSLIVPLPQQSAHIQRCFDAFSDIVVGQTAEGSPIRIRDQRDERSRGFMAESLSQLDPSVLKPIIAAKWLDQYDAAKLATAVRCPVHVLQADAPYGGMLTDPDVDLLATVLGERFRHTHFAGVGHSIHWSQPREICNLLRSMLSGK